MITTVGEATVTPPRPRIALGGLAFDPLTGPEVVSHVRRCLADGRGGRIVTPNVDILRQVRRDPDARRHVADSDLIVADGAPLVWASRLEGSSLPERVAGSDLIWSLSHAAAADGRRVYLIGGAPGGDRATAAIAGDRLAATCAGLHVAGACSPPIGFDRDTDTMDMLVADLRVSDADIVFVGLGFPKQERLIERLSRRLPSAWFLGCGAAIDFVAGIRNRAPVWMQRGGVEWLHRLASEPRRLFSRYAQDVPVAAGLLVRCGLRGLRR
ncbi:WecB/TagA/CpsF family glycosyltransferase [Stackebrandtia soli]|uniref:WecB/TagA/CpsF family glycosyltransferase n=1 Tax=Stackebrandtia soli TaxID=1892856 RepID=UPI0039ED545C